MDAFLPAIAMAAAVTLTPNCSSTMSCASEFTAAVASCRGQPSCTITFAQGAYDWAPSTTTTIDCGGGGITLDATAGAELRLHGKIGCLSFSNCNGVRVAGLAIDTARLPYTYGHAVSVDGSGFVLKIDTDRYPFPPASNATWAWLREAQAVTGYDPALDRPARDGTDLYFTSAVVPGAEPLKLTPNAAAGTVSATGLDATGAGIEVGSYYILRHQVYNFNGLEFTNCTDVAVTNTTVYSTPGMAMYAQLSTNLALDRFRVAKRDGRPMSANADGAHFRACGGAVSVVNSLFDGQGDDGMNVHSNFLQLQQLVPPNDAHVPPQPSNTAYLCLSQNGACAAIGSVVAVGDAVMFRSRRTLQSYFRTTLVDMRGPTTPGGPTLATFADALPPDADRYDFVESLRWLPSLRVSNSVFHNNRARGILLGVHDVVIERNTFNGTTGPGIKARAGNFEYCESTFLTNVTIEGNMFSNLNYAMARAPGMIWISSYVSDFDPKSGAPTNKGHYLQTGTVHRDITIAGNRFALGDANPAIYVDATDGLAIANNTLTVAPGTKRAPTDVDVSAQSVTHARVTGNTCAAHGAGGACIASVVAPQRTPVVIDTDVGTDADDSFAIALALHIPEFDVKMILCDSHDTQGRAKIAAKTLEAADRTDVVVGIGPKQDSRGGAMFGWAADYDLATYPGTIATDGVGALIDLVNKSATTVLVLVIAPCPNILRLLERAPELAPKIRVVAMSGSIYKGYSNAPPPSAEYNVHDDIPAARALYGAPWASTLMTAPLDTSHLVHVQGAAYRRMLSCVSPSVLAMLEQWFYWVNAGNASKHYMIDGHLLNAAVESKWLNDPVAVYLATGQARHLVQMQRLNVTVTDAGYTKIVNVSTGGGHPIDAAVGWANLTGFYDWMVSALCGPRVPPSTATATPSRRRLSSKAVARAATAPMPICSDARYCPAECAKPGANPIESTTSTQPQGNSSGARQFQASAAKAIAVARSFPGVARDLRGGFHLSLQYNCCYNDTALDAIGRATSTITWAPIAVRFRWVVCIGGALVVLADPVAQGALAALVSQVEWAMRAAGVPVHRLRMEEAPFHASLADINATWDRERGLAAVNAALGVAEGAWWNADAIVVDTLHLQGTNWTFHASG